MTTIRSGKSVTRKTAATIQHKPVVVKLHPQYMELHRAGCRIAYALTYEAAFTEAARRAANKVREERAAAKRAKKGRA
jgi:S-methylmethionine-dependent homocysteine/selenocysteine methylase